MFDVNFDNPAPQLLCHPDQKQYEKIILEKLNPYFLRDHFILFSSGTTGGDLKGYALSKKALFTNAEAVNKHFNLTSSDVWGLSLPLYHVGGLSVLARAHLLGNRVIDGRKWNPVEWVKKMEEVTITTLVPTQLYDLVRNNLTPPENLRYVIVGGDFLSTKLREKAISLGWPVIRTFGMSEVCSQLASSRTPESDDLEILFPHEVKIQEERLLVKSQSLFTLEFSLGEKFRVSTAKELCDEEGFYYTKDRARVTDNIIFPLGRIGEEFKVSGHLIDMVSLKNSLEAFLLEKNLFQKMELIVEPDERTGHRLVLLFLKEVSPNDAQDFLKTILPIKVDDMKAIDSFHRTSLGKLKKNHG